MKREFLKKLGLSNEVINKVMAENGKDIEAAKSKRLSESIKLQAANQTINDLQSMVKEFEGMDLKKLKEDISAWETKYKTDIYNIQKDIAIDIAIFQAKGKNPRVIKALIDKEKVKLKKDGTLEGLNLEELKQTDGYLFYNDKTAMSKAGLFNVKSSGIPRIIKVSYTAFVDLEDAFYGK